MGNSVNSSDRSYPLTSVQEGMIFHTLQATGSGVYLQQLIGHLNEPLCPQTFQNAWEELVRRHEILRTIFQWKDLNRPLQEVCSEVLLQFQLLDWRHIASPHFSYYFGFGIFFGPNIY